MSIFFFLYVNIFLFILTQTVKEYILVFNMERYQSGRTGAVLKTVDLHGSGGSNPSRSVSAGGVVER